MESVEAHLADVLAAIRPLPARELSLADAYGAVLDEDVTARWPLPSFDNSAMDGYAVIASDIAGASAESPVSLPVNGEIAAGDTGEHELSAGVCYRIMTGAAMPGGANAVIQVELTDGGSDQVAIRAAVAAGTSVRYRGGDAQPGDLLLEAGDSLGAVQLGLLAAAGHGTVRARPRPRLTVLSAGNELVEPGQPLVPGQIWESNSVMLAAAARAAGCDVTRYPVMRDDPDAVLAGIKEALADADLLITSGGVSMGGEHDVVKAALTSLGTVRFRKVAMQPGMPQGFGTVGPDQTPIFTLPGNPVSSYVSFQLFVAPAIDALLGRPAAGLRSGRAVLTADVHSPQGKRSFLRGALSRPIFDRDSAPQVAQVAPVSGQASHQLASLASANALIIVPEAITAMAAGETVDVLELP